MTLPLDEATFSPGVHAPDWRAAVRAAGGVVVGVLAVVDREDGGREAIEGAGFDARVDDPQLSKKDLNDTDAVVTGAACGIADTGSIVLTHVEDQGRRAITLVPDRHVCVVKASQVVSDVPEAIQIVKPAVHEGQPLTFISGGSATSDIELSRVDGVHGPRRLYVIVVDGC